MTEGDPAPFIPPAAERAHTGEVVGLVSGGGSEQARQLAVRLIRALLDRDRDAVRDMFAERVQRVYLSKSSTRAALARECMFFARRRNWRPQLAEEDVAEITEIRVGRVQREFGADAIPEGLRASDLTVQIPLNGTAEGGAGQCIQRSFAMAQIYVRPGPVPRIVGVYH